MDDNQTKPTKITAEMEKLMEAQQVKEASAKQIPLDDGMATIKWSWKKSAKEIQARRMKKAIKQV